MEQSFAVAEAPQWSGPQRKQTPEKLVGSISEKWAGRWWGSASRSPHTAANKGMLQSLGLWVPHSMREVTLFFKHGFHIPDNDRRLWIPLKRILWLENSNSWLWSVCGKLRETQENAPSFFGLTAFLVCFDLWSLAWHSLKSSTRMEKNWLWDLGKLRGPCHGRKLGFSVSIVEFSARLSKVTQLFYRDLTFYFQLKYTKRRPQASVLCEPKVCNMYYSYPECGALFNCKKDVVACFVTTCAYDSAPAELCCRKNREHNRLTPKAGARSWVRLYRAHKPSRPAWGATKCCIC